MYIPKPHQNDALESVYENKNGLLYKDRTQMVMACGTGKTYTSLLIAEKNIVVQALTESITVVLFPSLYLIEQTKREWEEQTKIIDFKQPLVICSNSTIGVNERDDVFEIEKSEISYNVTTNFEEIKNYLSNDSIRHKLIYSTYQSSHLLGKALMELGASAHLTLFDEAHKTATKNKRNDKSFSVALSNELFPSKKRLFMTATTKHYRFSEGIKDSEKEDLVFSMSSKKLYGEISYEFSMRKAIEKDVITDYQILGILIGEKNLDEVKRKNTKALSHENKLVLAKFKAIEDAMKKYDIDSGLTFHPTIKDSKEFSDKCSLNYTGDLKISHVDGVMPHKDRHEVMETLKRNKYQLVSNSKLLTEGVDVPGIGMAFIDKTMKSKIEITQLVGRVQRKSKNKNKTTGYILLPLFISDIEKIDEVLLDNEDLNSIFETINAFRQIDSQLREEVLYKKSNDIDNEPNESWDEAYSSVYSYKKLYNVLPGIDSLNEKITKLGEWVLLQIENMKSNKLSWRRIDKLNKLDAFTFDKTPRFKIEVAGGGDQEGSEFFREGVDKLYEHIESVVISKRNMTQDKDYILACTDFVKKHGIDSLKRQSIHLGLKIGQFQARTRKTYLALESFAHKDEMIEKYSIVHPYFLLNSFEINDKIKRDATKAFVDIFGINALETKTEHKGIKIGSYRRTMKKKFHHSDPEEKEMLISRFEYISVDYFKSRDDEHQNKINAAIEFVSKHGYEQLFDYTKHNGYSIGLMRSRARSDYRKLTSDKKKKEMEEKYNVIHSDFLKESMASEKDLFEAAVDFVSLYGYKNFTNSTVHNGLRIGAKREKNVAIFNKLTDESEKKRLVEEFTPIHEDYFLNKRDVQRRDKINLCIEFFKLNTNNKIVRKTIYKGERLGDFKDKERQKFRKLSKEEDKIEMVKVFIMLPGDFLGEDAAIVHKALKESND